MLVFWKNRTHFENSCNITNQPELLLFSENVSWITEFLLISRSLLLFGLHPLEHNRLYLLERSLFVGQETAAEPPLHVALCDLAHLCKSVELLGQRCLVFWQQLFVFVKRNIRRRGGICLFEIRKVVEWRNIYKP